MRRTLQRCVGISKRTCVSRVARYTFGLHTQVPIRSFSIDPVGAATIKFYSGTRIPSNEQSDQVLTPQGLSVQILQDPTPPAPHTPAVHYAQERTVQIDQTLTSVICVSAFHVLSECLSSWSH